MSKIYDALKHAERERSVDQGDALAQVMAQAAAERDVLRAEMRACQEQVAALAARIHATLNDAGPMGEKVEALGAQQQRHQERIDRAAKDQAAAVQDLYSRIDDLSRDSEQTRSIGQADVASVRQQLVDALRDVDDRLTQLAHGGRTAHNEQQLVLAELRQQMAAMEVLQTGSRTELRELVESANERAGDASRRLDTLSGALLNHDALLGRMQTAQAELKTLLQRSEKRAREIATEAVQRIDEQAQHAERLGAGLESLSVRFADAEVAARGTAQRWQEDVDRLCTAVSESAAAVGAANTEGIEAVAARVDTVHQRLARVDEERRGLRERSEQQHAEQRQGLASLSAELARVADVSRGESQAAQRELATRIDGLGEAQSETDRRLRVTSDTLHAGLAAQRQSAEQLEALRAQLAPMAETQARLQTLVEGIDHAQATADEALSRVAAIDHLRAASLAALRQEMAALQADKTSLRDAVQASLTAQPQITAEIDALRAEVAPLAKSQAQLHEVADGVRRVQVTADDAARRLGILDAALGASLATLRQQIEALQAEKASLQGTLQASVAAQQQATAEINALRVEVAPLVESQARLQQLADGIGRAQLTAEEAARRIAAI